MQLPLASPTWPTAKVILRCIETIRCQTIEFLAFFFLVPCLATRGFALILLRWRADFVISWKAVAEKTLAEQQKQLGKPVTFELRHLDEAEFLTTWALCTAHRSDILCYHWLWWYENNDVICICLLTWRENTNEKTQPPHLIDLISAIFEPDQRYIRTQRSTTETCLGAKLRFELTHRRSVSGTTS